MIRRVGFVGLGNMGRHMAANLLKSGHHVVLHDMNKKVVEDLTTEYKGKAVAAASLADLGDCDVVITMLPASAHVENVYCDAKEGLLSSVGPGTLLIDSSTIDAGVSREIAAKARSKGLLMVDAPVSGGVGGAEAGTLTFMVGGEEKAYSAAFPFLEKMGKNVVHCGGEGNGQVAKMCNNLILGITMCGLSEGMNLGVKMGMDPKVLAGIVNTSSGRCWSSDTYNPVPGVMEGVPASRDYEGGFAVDLMKKDLGIALKASTESQSETALGERAHDIYSTISESGQGNKDFGVVFDYLHKK